MKQMITKNGRFSKFLAVVMSIAMVLCMMPLTVAMAAEDDPIGEFILQDEVVVYADESVRVFVILNDWFTDDDSLRESFMPHYGDALELNGWLWPEASVYVAYLNDQLEFVVNFVDPVEASSYSAEVWLTYVGPGMSPPYYWNYNNKG